MSLCFWAARFHQSFTKSACAFLRISFFREFRVGASAEPYPPCGGPFSPGCICDTLSLILKFLAIEGSFASGRSNIEEPLSWLLMLLPSICERQVA